MTRPINKTPRILVIGDLIVDHYLWGSCERISPEAPVQVIKIDNETSVLGGAGNVVNNLNSLGAIVDVISVIGECEVSKQLRQLLADINIRSNLLVKQNDRIASKKSRIIADQQQVVRYDRESSDEINSDSQISIIKTFESIVVNYEVVLLSDYGKGILTFDLTQSLIRIAKKYNKKILVDPKGLNYSKYYGAYLLTPNKKEASEATQISIIDDKSLKRALVEIKRICNLEISLITLSESGIAVLDDDLRIHPTLAQEVFDVTGAGDTVLASLGFAVASNMNIDEAIKFANLASGVVVGKVGSATASMNEIIAYESGLKISNFNSKIKSWEEISDTIRQIKNKDHKIVFTNGCFDILHIGHIKYLEKAKSFGDLLIIGLNSDKSVSKNKGDDRPINNQNDRAYILASLALADFIVIFDDVTPYNLIKLIQPDVLVKGGDYEGKDVIGQDIAKKLEIVEFIKNKSTSKTIERIKNIK